MRVVVFTGPTIGADEGRHHLDAAYLPPVAQGDVYRVARARPTAIGIIDGYFEQVPAVFHKEILWAMRQGIHVLGAASMGALRAAELADFGMVGVGQIFQAYRRGELTDDDEVALAHAPEDEGFRPLSEPMVNIRATLRAAGTAGVISPSTAERLVAMAKATYYVERAYPQLLAAGRRRELPPAELDAFAGWLPTGRVDQKRVDAVAMLEQLNELVTSAPGPLRVSFAFSHTTFFEQLCRDADRHLVVGSQVEELSAGDLLAEAALDPSFELIWTRAVAQLLAARWAVQWGIGADSGGLGEMSERFWVDRGVHDRAAARSWMVERGIDEPEVERLIRVDAVMRMAQEDHRLEIESAILDQLRLSELYPVLHRRASEKQTSPTYDGYDELKGPEDGTTDDLLRWWFEDRLGVPVPADPMTHPTARGFRSPSQFIRALASERRVTPDQ